MSLNSAHHAANRFGLGSSAASVSAARQDSRAWVLSQLNNEPVVVEGALSVRQVLADYQRYWQVIARLKNADGDTQSAIQARQESQAFSRQVRQATQTQTMLRFRHGVQTEHQVQERLVQFWSNHFTVSQNGNRRIAGAALAYENEAIRPHLNDHFHEMVIKVASHPVMLLYLDNYRSAGPNSRLGRRRGLGLNENFARELLELHTLGVNGGYNQDDVESLAKILTGWSVGGLRIVQGEAEPGQFVFLDAAHEPGNHRLLGKTFTEDDLQQGISAIKYLARHPSTAMHIATKLIQHFVPGTPDPQDVKTVAQVFLETDGHLPSVHEAVLSLEAPWESVHSIFRTPWELFTALFRGLTLPDIAPRHIMRVLKQTGHVPFSATSPAGWPEGANFWASPQAIKQRIGFGMLLAERFGNNIDPLQAAESMIDPLKATGLLTAINQAESRRQGLALLAASPEVQWR